MKFLALVLGLGLVAGCASGLKKTTPELSRLEGKKVALVEVEGELSSRSIVEVALVNQLMQTGSFTLIGKKEVEAARGTPELGALDWRGLAKKVGAAYTLKAKVLEFNAETHEGYSKEEVVDSQLAAERGDDDAKTERIFKAKSLDGKVRVQLEFASLTEKDDRIGVAEAEDHVVQDEKLGGMHLPPKIRFLEKIANSAFHDFFEKYK